MIALLLALVASATIEIETPPTPGEETIVRVLAQDGRPRAGETVRVVHRPGLAGQRELAIGITDARGRVRWTPAEAGVAVVRAGEERLPVRIAPPEAPRDTLVLLGLLLLAAGGALGYGLVPMRIPTRKRPST